MTQWQPFKPTFMPIDFYEDGAEELNEQGFKFMRSCALVDMFLLNLQLV